MKNSLAIQILASRWFMVFASFLMICASAGVTYNLHVRHLLSRHQIITRLQPGAKPGFETYPGFAQNFFFVRWPLESQLSLAPNQSRCGTRM
ncbi:unnamed protein product [Rhodiola kirilowii]